jgi:hypothetical protein
MGDITDPMAGLTPAQAAQSHIFSARRLLADLEAQNKAQNGGGWTADQVIAIAQVHAMLAAAAAMAWVASGG